MKKSIRDVLFDTHSPLLDDKATFKPKRRMACPKAVKESVWLKYFGHKMTGECYVCKRPISFMNFEVGHNKPFAKGGKWNINNLRAICRTCNRSMGTMTIEAFKKNYFDKRVPRKKMHREKRTKATQEKRGISNPLLTFPNPLLTTPNPLFSSKSRKK